MAEETSLPYQLGERVAFVPDEDTIRRYGRAFARLRICPGDVGPVVRLTGDLVRMGDSLKAFPRSQFRRATQLSSATIGEIRASFEAFYYRERGPNPFRLGQTVRFIPSDFCEWRHGDAYRAVGMYPRQVGTVTAIRPDGYLEIDRFDRFYHWSEFAPVD